MNDPMIGGMADIARANADARTVISLMVRIRSTAVDGVLTVAPRIHRFIWELCMRRDRFRMLGVDVDAIERELGDGLGELRVVVNFRT